AEAVEVAVEVVVRAGLEVDASVRVEDELADDLEDDTHAGCGVDAQLSGERARAVQEVGGDLEITDVRERLAGRRVAQSSGRANTLHGSDRCACLVVERRRRALDVELAVDDEARAGEEVR